MGRCSSYKWLVHYFITNLHWLWGRAGVGTGDPWGWELETPRGGNWRPLGVGTGDPWRWELETPEGGNWRPLEVGTGDRSRWELVTPLLKFDDKSDEQLTALPGLASLEMPLAENYLNDPKILDRKVWANSADPDQTAIRGAVSDCS